MTLKYMYDLFLKHILERLSTSTKHASRFFIRASFEKLVLFVYPYYLAFNA